MNYKLAKQLEKAGFRVKSPVFPQVADKQGYTDTGDEILRDYYDYHKESWNYEGEHYFIPTLSELIEACGDEFQLTKWDCHNKIEKKVDYKWIASTEIYYDDRGYQSDIGEGKTPEEAVAKLYIELNKK